MEQQLDVPIPKIITKSLLINKFNNKLTSGNNILKNRNRHDSPINRPISRKIVKRDVRRDGIRDVSIDLPKVFGWEPLESTSMQIMKMLQNKKLPVMPYNAEKLLQKRRTVAKSDKYPKIRRQPVVEQGVEYETMLPLGYEEYEALQEAREPPPVDVDNTNSNYDGIFASLNKDTNEYDSDVDYEDFAEQLMSHYSSTTPERVEKPTDNKKPEVTHHHEQAHIQRYPNMHRQRVRPQKKRKRRPNKPFLSSPKRRPEKPPSRFHQRLKHPANHKSPLRQPPLQHHQPPPPPPPPPPVEQPKAEQQFQEDQKLLNDESMLPTIYEPTSLQSILATHKIHTNVLRTRPRTQNVAYYPNGEDSLPVTLERQDGDLVSPYYYSKDGEWEEVYPHTPMTLSKYQTMIEKSKEEQEEEERRQYYMRQEIEKLQKEIEEERAKNEELKRATELSKRIDNIEKEEKGVEESGPISKSLAQTAILALKLGDKIMQLYESVEPYVVQAN